MIGPKLQRTRTALGLTLAEFANLVAVDVGTIAKWESGEQRPDFEQTRFLSDMLRILEGELGRA